MPIPKNIISSVTAIPDTFIRANEGEWIETTPGMAWLKILWTGPESGGWAVLFRWKKGHVAQPHKHLSASHSYILSGALKARDVIFRAGDYVYEPNGVLHDATEAIEDSEYIFISNGPLLYFEDEKISGYFSWEELERMRRTVSSAVGLGAHAA
jgi:quercetin dioxygenase-like cupin family protein